MRVICENNSRLNINKRKKTNFFLVNNSIVMIEKQIYLRIVSQNVNFFCSLFAEFTPILREGLKLNKYFEFYRKLHNQLHT